MKNLLPYLLVALAASLLIPGRSAQAQITGRVEANIPFPFYVGDSHFPAGKYIVSSLFPTSETAMEISNPADTLSAFVEIDSTQSIKSPKSNELIFKRIGNRYFLTKVFDADDKYGATFVDEGYSKLYKEVSQNGEERHVPMVHINGATK